MNNRGWKYPPILLLLFYILLPLFLFSKDIPFYTIPEETARRVQPNPYREIYPQHNWLELSDNWEVYDLQGDTLGTIHSPFSFAGKSSLLFKKTFPLENLDKKSDYFLHLPGINGALRIRINEHLLYEGHQNYLHLKLFIPKNILREKENIIQVDITPNWGVQVAFPHWFPINLPRIDSGIINRVFLEKTPPVYFKNLKVRTRFQAPDLVISIFPELNRRPVNAVDWKLRAQIQISEGKIIYLPNLPADSLKKEFKFTLNEEQLWSPENPDFVRFVVILDSAGKDVDKMVYPVAARDFQWTGTNFTLNNRIFPIKGINYVYQDVEGTSLFNRELAEADIRQIKKKGFNAIRTVLYPLPESFYQLSDQAGLLIFQDLPIILNPGISDLDKQTLDKFKQYFYYMNKLAERHPSIAAIGISVFFDPFNPLADSQLKELLQILPESYLPIYINSLSPDNLTANRNTFRIVEILNRRTNATLNQQLRRLESEKDIPSAFSKAISYRVDSTTIAFDIYQIKNLATLVEKSFRENRLPGFFLYTFSDFYTYYPSVQNGLSGNFSLNNYGLFTLKRQPKIAWSKLKQISPDYSQEKLLITEAHGRYSYWYILLGIANLFVLLFMYRKFKEFRHNLNYSIKKPHGFFVNLQERIYIPLGQSLFLLLIISINGAISLSAISYYFRNNLLFDYILSLLFFDPKIKLWVIYLIWKQPLFLLAATAANFLLIYLMAVPIKILSWFGDTRIPFPQAVAANIWAASPFVFLVPFSIFLYNFLITIKSYWILLAILLYFHVWFYFRWINATRVLTGRLYSRVFLLFTGILVLLVGGLLLYYNQQINLTDHIKLIYHIYRFLS